MRWLYSLAIFLYGLGIKLSAVKSEKAAKWVNGRKDLFKKIEAAVDGRKTIWLHCASLGEFEQGRPVLEALRKKYPNKFVVLTFFSPSGYEIRKDYPLADLVCYMPLDTTTNARKCVKLLNPQLAVFIKYEFWHNHLNELYKNQVPTYLVSGIFRKNQIYFRVYGGWFRQSLKRINHLFLQDEKSLEIALNAGLKNSSISGDTRFDRVFGMALNPLPVSEVENYLNGLPTLVVGSSWPEDEDLICRYINESAAEVKFIIAPHEIHESHLEALEQKLNGSFTRLSRLENNTTSKVLIVDTIGLLGRLYQYGTTAYVGGGFGAGIHNTLEPATFGLPVVFGPNYTKFKEAADLLEIGAAEVIRNYKELTKVLDKFMHSPEGREAGMKAKKYVAEHKGATDKIMAALPVLHQ